MAAAERPVRWAALHRLNDERAIITAWDLAQAKAFLEYYLDEELHDIRRTFEIVPRALTLAIVVSYARPFSGNREADGSRSMPLLKEAVGALDLEHRNAHSAALKRRNHSAAHSDGSAHDVEILQKPAGPVLRSQETQLPLEAREAQCLLENTKHFESAIGSHIASLLRE